MATEAGVERELSLREFGSMWYVTDSIPLEAQRNLVHTKITLTALSCLEQWIALASNVGIVYLYYRPMHTLHRLKVPNYDGHIRTLSLHTASIKEEQTVLVATGTELGRIAIFVMEPPYAHPEVILLEVHVTPVTSLLWSTNEIVHSLRLYSGDQDGWVYSSKISVEHQVELVASQSVIQEDYEIVQLSLSSDNSLLLISTTSRAVVWSSKELTVRQVGRQSRKSLEVLGATFFPLHTTSSTASDVIYAARPNFRLWRVNPLGQVLETIKFHDIVMSSHIDKIVLSSTPGVVQTDGEHTFLSFGRLLPYSRTFLLAWSSLGFLLIDTRTHSLFLRTPPLSGLVDLAINHEEIFLLVFPRTLVRLALSSDPFHPPFQHLKEATPVDMLQIVIQPFEKLGSLISTPHSSKQPLSPPNNDSEISRPRAKTDGLIGWFKRRRSSTSSQISRTSSSGSLSSMNFENPPLKPPEPEAPPLNSDATIQPKESVQTPDPLQDLPPIFGVLDDTPPPDDVVFVPTKKKKKKKKRESTTSQGSLQSTEMETSLESVEVFAPSTLLQPSKVTPNMSEDDIDAAMDRIIQAYKAQKIVSSSSAEEKENKAKVEETPPSSEIDSNLPAISSSDSSSHAKPFKNSSRPFLVKKATLDIYNSDSVDIPDEDIPEKPNEENKLDSSIPEQNIPDSKSGSGDASQTGYSLEKAYAYRGNWVQCPLPPGPILSLCIWKDFIIGTNRDLSIFYASLGGLGLKWSMVPRKSSQQVAAAKDYIVFLHNSNVIISKKPLSCPSDIAHASLCLLERDVQHIDIDDNLLWCVKNNGSLCYHTLPPDVGLSLSASPVGVPYPVMQVASYNGRIWLLTDTTALWGPAQILAGGKDEGIWIWDQLQPPSGVKSWLTIALGDQGTGWALDDTLTLWFTMEPFQKAPVWWQVELSEPLYQEAPSWTSMSLSPLLSKAASGSSHPCIVASRDHGVWVGQGSLLLHASRQVVGHRWSEISLAGNRSLKWRLVAAEGQDGESGLVWGVLVNGAIFCWSDIHSPHQVSSPLGLQDFVLDICAAPGVCWLLTAKGHVFVRRGLKEGTTSEGADWVELNLDQLGDEKLESLCCSTEVAWGVNTEGKAYVSLGPSVPLPKPSPSRAWIAADLWEPSNPVVQIRLGTNWQLWARDAEGEIWTHYGMSPNVPIGTSWARVTGLPGPANHLSVSRDAVWVLATLPSTNTREVFVRCGAPPFGDFWQRVPSPSNSQLDTLSASQDNQVWGIKAKDGALVKLSTTSIDLVKADEPRDLPIPISPGTNVEDWEVVTPW